MAEQLNRQTLAEQATVHAEPPAQPHSTQVDRTFELPAGLYRATVALYLGFIATMALAFSNPQLIIPLVLFALIIVAGFGIPAIWAGLARQALSKAKSWARFQRDGIMTGSGRAGARDAVVQVLILPVLIFIWGVCAVVVAALV